MAGTAATETKIKAATVFIPVPRTNAAAVTNNSTNTRLPPVMLIMLLLILRASPVKVNVPTTSPTAAHTTIISTELLAPSTSAVINALTPIRVWGLIQLTKIKEKIA